MENYIYSPVERYGEEGDRNWVRIVVPTVLGPHTIMASVDGDVWAERGIVVPMGHGKRNSRELTPLEQVYVEDLAKWVTGLPNQKGFTGYGPLGNIKPFSWLPAQIQQAVAEFHIDDHSEEDFKRVVLAGDRFPKMWCKQSDSQWCFLSLKTNMQSVTLMLTNLNYFIVRPKEWNPSIAYDSEDYIPVEIEWDLAMDIYRLHKRVNYWMYQNPNVDYNGSGANHGYGTLPESLLAKLEEVRKRL